jgi:LysM repeat protein
MPSFSTVAYSLLVPAGAVLAGSFIPSAPILRRESCKTTYYSQNGDTCAKMDQMFGLESGTILATNPFLTCSDVWTNTPICVPDGPHPCSQTYTSKQNDTCESIEKAFGLPEGAILAANTFLTCSDIWVNTPICIPNGGSTPAISTKAKCKSTYYSTSKDTCDELEKAHNLASGTIKAANSFVTCDDIWPGTPLCIPDGPYRDDIGCTIQTYYSQPKDTW